MKGGGTQDTVRAALLLGSDHAELGEITIREVTPKLALGISRGRFPKGYPHTDPNEDAVYAATDGTTTIISVADGHRGFDAALAAITTVSELAPRILEEEPQAIVRTIGEAAIHAMLVGIPQLPEPRNASRTSLTVCALRASTIATLTIGDSACFAATVRRSKRLGKATDFLSPETTAASLRVDTAGMSQRSAVVAATDGFFDFASSADKALCSAQSLGAAAGVEHLIAAAFSGGAGDNIAIAIHRPT